MAGRVGVGSGEGERAAGWSSAEAQGIERQLKPGTQEPWQLGACGCENCPSCSHLQRIRVWGGMGEGCPSPAGGSWHVSFSFLGVLRRTHGPLPGAQALLVRVGDMVQTLWTCRRFAVYGHSESHSDIQESCPTAVLSTRV